MMEVFVDRNLVSAATLSQQVSSGALAESHGQTDSCRLRGSFPRPAGSCCHYLPWFEFWCWWTPLVCAGPQEDKCGVAWRFLSQKRTVYLQYSCTRGMLCTWKLSCVMINICWGFFTWSEYGRSIMACSKMMPRLSRARALSIMVGSPTLGKCRVETREEMEIQNRFVKWVNHGF